MRKLPKSTLHVHLEATVKPSESKKLSKGKYPEHLVSKEDPNKWHFPDKNFGEFLGCYDDVTKSIALEDMAIVAYEYLKRCHEQGLIYAELGISPDHFRENKQEYYAKGGLFSSPKKSDSNLLYLRYVKILEKVILQAEQEFGMTVRLRVVLVRHEKEHCKPLVEAVLANPHPLVVGFDLAGAEAAFPAPLFKEEFDLVHAHNKTAEHKLGLGAHAGEHCDAKSIVEAVEVLGLSRVGHGVSSLSPNTDAETLEKIQSLKVGFEVCPASNIALGLFNDYSEHCLPKMQKAGLKICLGDDDPVFKEFSEIGPEYEQTQQAYGYTDAEMLVFTRNAIDMAFCSDALKKQLHLQIDCYEKFEPIAAILAQKKLDESVSVALNQYYNLPNVTTLYQLSKSVQTAFKEGGDLSKLLICFQTLMELHQEISELADANKQKLLARIEEFHKATAEAESQLVLN